MFQSQSAEQATGQIAAAPFHASPPHANPDGRYLVATTTVWSGLSYVFSKDAVKILSDNKKDQAEQDKKDETKQP